MFAWAFWLLAVDRLVIVVIGQNEIASPAEYLLRLGAFLVIIAAIIEKNRMKR